MKNFIRRMVAQTTDNLAVTHNPSSDVRGLAAQRAAADEGALTDVRHG